MTARVDSQSWERSQNVGGQCDLRATVLVNIWTDISLQTDRLALNVIGIGPRRAARLWRRRREVLFGLPPVNPQSLLQEKSQVFRHRLDAKGPQPFEAAAMFEHSWETPEWVEDYAFELVLLTGAPYRRFSVGLDFDRGRERYRPL